jgi:hypothetical protein
MVFWPNQDAGNRPMASYFLYRRRDFITLLGGAAAAWPLAARAAVSDGGGRVSYLAGAGRYPTTSGRVPSGSQRCRLYRGTKRCDRISFRRQSKRAAARFGGRSGSASGRPNRRDRRHRAGLAAKAATSAIPVVIVAGDDPSGWVRSPASIGREDDSASRDG